MRYLGIDYGKRKIGLSLSEGILASPFKVLQINSLKDALNKVQQVIKVKNIDVIVVGMPESGESKSITRNFIKQLRNLEQDKKVIEVDETLTTENASSLLKSLDISKKEDDDYSAMLILQNYLDSLK